MGAYTSDALCQSGYGLGVTGVPGQLKAAVFLPIDQVLPFDGGKVVKFRVGLDSATPIANAFIYGISQSGNIEEIITADFSGNAKKGWNEVTPKEPFTLNLSSYQGVLMGYEYKQTASNYPISTVDEGTPYELFIFGNLFFITSSIPTLSALMAEGKWMLSLPSFSIDANTSPCPFSEKCSYCEKYLK